jgi:hypothetical protein
MVFDILKLEDILDHYNQFGFVGVTGLLSEDSLLSLEKSIESSSFDVTLEKPAFVTGDIVLKSKELLDFCFRDDVKKLCAKLLSCSEVEVQHSKYNSKPVGEVGNVILHQDFPFFPHTSLSLMAMGIYLDESSKDNGCVFYYPYKKLLSHYGDQGEFISEVSEMDKKKLAGIEPIPFIAPKGTVCFHHCLTPHFSGPSLKTKRRLAIVQLRDSLNKQIGGAIWKCGGINLHRMSKETPKMILDGKEILVRNLWEPKEYRE